MICRECGTEIADKALICYRCGTAVDEPISRPPAAKKGRSWLVYAVFAVLVLFAIISIWLR